MKLVVKLPKNKLPFIGVQLDGDGYDNRKLNQDLILDHKYAGYRVVLEFIKNYVNLRLISDEGLIVRFYNHLEYDKVKLRNWFYLADKAKGLNFSHTAIVHNKEIVLKTLKGDRLFVLKLYKCEILSPDAVLNELPY